MGGIVGKSLPPQPAAPSVPDWALYSAGSNGGGLIQKGNIDLYNRPPVVNPDGSISTVRSIGVGMNGNEVLIPTVVNGRVVSNKEAIDEYRRTGKHLGIFDTPENADAYAKKLHEQYARGFYGR